MMMHYINQPEGIYTVVSDGFGLINDDETRSNKSHVLTGHYVMKVKSFPIYQHSNI